MVINKTLEQARLCVAPVGRLDATTAPELEKELDSSLDGVKELVLDFKELSYISSAGLRVILKAQKQMKGSGKMKITGANAVIMGVFEITGFTDIITIE